MVRLVRQSKKARGRFRREIVGKAFKGFRGIRLNVAPWLFEVRPSTVEPAEALTLDGRCRSIEGACRARSSSLLYRPAEDGRHKTRAAQASFGLASVCLTREF